MKICPSGDWATCPYHQTVNGEVFCKLPHPEEDCDDYACEMGDDDDG